MCKKCGCNTCESIRGPLLTEGRSKPILTEGFKYHIGKNIPLFESVYRIGSKKHLLLIKEARKLYSRDLINLCEEDVNLVNTHIGEFGSYKGESVPLDLPMLNEINIGAIAGGVAASRKKKRSKKELAQMIDIAREMGVDVSKYEKYLNEKLSIAGKEVEKIDKIGNNPENWVVKYKDGSEEPYLKHLVKEAEFKGKEVALNKPKRGGPKAYYVYVKDGDKVKKVTFGSGGLRAKIKNKEARNAFAKRHNCDKKKDRTKAGYWSCNLPRYAKMLGLGANMNTYW